MGSRAISAAKDNKTFAGDDFTQRMLDLQDSEESPPMTFEQIAAILVREPWNCSLAQIEKLNDYQIYEIYFRPRSEDEEEGRDDMADRMMAASMTDRSVYVQEYKKTFVELWKGEGLTDEAIEAKWQESEVGRTESQRHFGCEAERGNPSSGGAERTDGRTDQAAKTPPRN